MKIIDGIGFQGDVCFIRIGVLPEGATETKTARDIIVTHSETGHHHMIHDGEARLFKTAERDPLVCYLQVDGAYADVVHHRPWDTHETVRLPAGAYKVVRQREYTPEGWRRVED